MSAEELLVEGLNANREIDQGLYRLDGELHGNARVMQGERVAFFVTSAGEILMGGSCEPAFKSLPL